MPLYKKILQEFFAERDRFVLFVPVLLGTGAGWYFGLYDEPPLWLPVLAFIALAAGMYALRRHFAYRFICSLFLIVALGFLAASIRTHMVATPVIYGKLFMREVTGRIDDIQDREKGEKLILKDVSIERLPERRIPVRVSVSLRKDDPSLHIGDTIKLKATLYAPPSPAMPGSYDFTRALYYDSIGAVGYAISTPEIVAHGDTNSFEEWLNDLRLRLNDRIMAPMGKANGSVAAAMMVGEQTAVPKDVGNAMRDAGIYHVLSISGLHMSLAVALLYISLRFLFSLYPPLALRLPVKKIAAAIGLLGALAYLMLAGYPVPAVRSFVMVACVMLAILFDRSGISLYSLAWAATLVILWQPDSMLGASFQLSFAATLAIVAFYERYSYLLFQSNAGFLRKLWLYFFGLIVTSLVATLATTPLVIYHFNRFTIWGIVANTLMLPLASFWIMPAAVISFLAMPFGLERWPLVWLDYGIGLMIHGSRWVANFPHASFAVPSPTFWGLLLIIYGGLWLALWRRKWRLLGLPVMLAGLSTIALHQPYDFLVSDDGSKAAVRLENGDFLFISGRPTSFDGQIWLRSHGKDKGLTMSDMEGIPVACDGMKCVTGINGKFIVVADKKQTEHLCDSVMYPTVLISQDIINDDACKNVTWLMDRRFLERSGAIGIRAKGKGLAVFTADQYRGNRPWISRRNSHLLKPGNSVMMPDQPQEEHDDGDPEASQNSPVP